MNARKTLGLCMTALLLATTPAVADDEAQDATAGSARPLQVALVSLQCPPVYWANNQPKVDPDCIERPLP